MKIKDISETLRKQTIAHSNRTGFIPSDYWTKIQASHQVLSTFNHSTENLNSLPLEFKKRAQDEALNNLVVNVVTAYEVFIKDFVKLMCDNKNIQKNVSGINELLKDKEISLTEVLKISKIEDLTAGNLVVATRSFLDLDTVESVLNKITGENFFSNIEVFKITPNPNDALYGETPFSIKERYPDWRESTKKLIKERHEHVHQTGKKTEISYEEVTVVIEIVGAMIEAVSQKYNLLKHVRQN